MSLTKHALDIKNSLKEMTTKDESPGVASNSLQALIGAGLVKGSIDPIVGQKTIYHGTNPSNVDSILREGIIKSKAGSPQGAFANLQRSGMGQTMAGMMDDVSGKVYTTGSPLFASYMSSFSDPNSATNKSMKELSEAGFTNPMSMMDWPDGSMFPKEKPEVSKIKSKYTADQIKDLFTGRDKKIVTGKLPWDVYTNQLKADPDAAPLGWKHLAQISEQDIDPKYLKGSSTFGKSRSELLKKFPSYVKNYPLRFLMGLGMLGGGGYLAQKGARGLYDSATYQEPLKNKLIDALGIKPQE